MEVILDSGFILHAMRKKIDFVSQLEEQGFKIRVPREMVQEMKDRRLKSFPSHEERMMIDKAIKILEKNNIKSIDVGKQRIAEWLLHKGKEGYYIATTNAEIKHRVPRVIEIFESRGTVEPVEKGRQEIKLKKRVKEEEEWPRRFSEGGKTVKGYVGRKLEPRRLRFGEPQFHRKEIYSNKGIRK